MKSTTASRILALILAILMLAPLAVSCGKSNKGDNKSTGTTENPKNPGGSAYTGETVILADADTTPVIYIDENDCSQSVRAAYDLCNDFKEVIGRDISPVSEVSALQGAGLAVIIGTLGHSELIDSLDNSGLLDTSGIKGEWEAFTIQVIESTEPDIKTAVVIAGSDKRGTIYGAYTLSELIGVSPWYWWGDIEIEKKTVIELPLTSLVMTDKPDVKYRGIFLNDEENLTAWSEKFKSATNQGAPNPEVYARVFELILRLKANTLWPAMHAGSDAFNEYKNPKTGVSYNAELADAYGVVMSASHCEMMLRDNEGEWQDWAIANQKKYNIQKVNDSWRQGYDYTVNPEAMNAYWEERVAENYRFENIYMIGLRGVHDSGINASKLKDTSYAGKATVVKKAVEAQLAILTKYEKKYEEETGEKISFQTCYCVYKEAAEYYKYDISLPESCYLMYCEDNHGYVRTTPTDSELETYSGVGMYYHISYWGGTTSYLWLANTPLTLIAEEMRKCYYSGEDDIWILNVGDIKPGEIKAEYFLDLAWDIEAHTEHNTEDFMSAVLTRDFGLDNTAAAQLAADLTEFYQIMRNYIPDQMSKDGYPYSVTAFGGEGQLVLNRLSSLYDKSLAVLNALPEGKKASYYEMIHYTVAATLHTTEKYVYESMNAVCINEERYASANLYADLAEQAYSTVLSEIAYYNTKVANGKWNKILNPYNNKNGMPNIDAGPDVSRVSSEDLGRGVGISAEKISQSSDTLTFGSLNNECRFIDVFNKGGTSESFALSAPSWLIIKDNDGSTLTGAASGALTVYNLTVDAETRYYLTVDYKGLTAGQHTEGSITCTDGYGAVGIISLSAFKTAVNPEAEKAAGHTGYYEQNGLVSIEAENFSANVARNGFSWKVFESLARSCNAVKSVADEGFSNKKFTTGIKEAAPYLDYEIYFETTGSYSGIFYRLPTLNESASGRTTCSLAWSFDDSAVSTVRGTSIADVVDTGAWAVMTKLNIEELPFKLTVDKPGWHTLRVYMTDCNIVIDKIVLSDYELPYSRLGAPETFNTLSFTPCACGILPELSLDKLTFGSYSVKFDFLQSAGYPQEGYKKVAYNYTGSESCGWYWNAPSSLKAYRYTDNAKYSKLYQSFICGTETTVFNVLTMPDTEFIVTLTAGDPTGAAKASGMSVICNGKPCLSDINISAAGISSYCFKASSGSDGLLSFTFGGQWIVSSLEIYKYQSSAAEGGAGAFTENSAKSIIIEAEAALEMSDTASNTPATDSSGKKWCEVAGIYGSAMTFGPDTGTSYSSTDPSTSKSAKMTFSVKTAEAGNYTLYALIKSTGADDDSFIALLDGAQPKTTNITDDSVTFVWKQIGVFSVSAAGEHTLTIMGREDGMVIDRLLLKAPSAAEPDYDGTSVRK